MKKINRRAVSVLLIAALVICGLVVYVLRYIDDGRDWALYFSRANSGSSGEILDRNGVLLAAFDATENAYNSDALTRTASYHVTGDYWGRTPDGLLTTAWNDMQGFSLLTGTTLATSSSVSVTVDTRLNSKAYELLDGRTGAVLMMNYETGELLCMVSTPSIDPMDAESEPAEGTFINRCLSATFTPGSVFKLITAAAAIENIPDIYERSFYCEGSIEVAGIEINCAGEHYTQTFEQALANSCNCAFARIAIMLGQDTMIEYVRNYGFLASHELGNVKTAAGSYPLEFVGDPELAWSGIGQSTDLISPYALLRFVAATANGGIVCEPKLILDGEPSLQSRLIDADTADKLSRMMNYNVAYGYGGESRFPGLNISGKTGTAELGDGTSHSWFTGFLNDSEHPYAFVVLIERGGGGLSNAGVLAAELLTEAVTLN